MKTFSTQESQQIQKVSSQLLNYYVVNRQTGISYEIFRPAQLTPIALAWSSLATDGNPVRINVTKLIKGLSRGKYRLVAKA